MKNSFAALIPFALLVIMLLIPATGSAQKPTLEIRARVDHAFDRLAFGPRPGEVDEIVKKGEPGLQNWIQAQLDPESIDDSTVEAILGRHDILKMSIEELTEKYNNDGSKSPVNDDPNKKPDEIRKAWASAKLTRALLSRRQFQERLVDFWYNHFNVDQRKGKDRWFFGAYERDSIRPHLFGTFYELLRATARHPAMLFFLDNHLSRSVGGPKGKQNPGVNENYARELMELHTLGVNGGYTQADVKEVARILTGWTISDVNKMPAFQFKERMHDFEQKRVMNWDFPAGGAEEEGERLLKLLAMHPATARHISTLLVEAFVGNPAPVSLVDRLTKKYLATDGSLKAVYSELVHSPEFWDIGVRSSLVKDHFNWTISAVRILGGEVIWKNQLVNEIAKLGEPLYQCAPPTGYRLRAEDFINSGSLLGRLNLSLRLAASRIDGVYESPPSLGQRKFGNENEFIQALQNAMGLPMLSASTHHALQAELTDEVWKLGTQEPRPFILARLMGLLLASPEFQRM